MKGIILSGGTGSRLFPLTNVLSKQILPVYDKPMIYYPLSVLMLAGIREILIISSPRDLPVFERLLGDGSDYGLRFEYKVQERPAGLAQAFIIGEDFIDHEPVCMILGDNLFYGQSFNQQLERCARLTDGAVIFGYYVKYPNAYGVVEFDENMNAISIEEKPELPKSHYAVPGLYFYDGKVSEIAKTLKPSKRNELEITDLSCEYLKRGKLKVELMGRGMAWLDTGTHQDLLRASNFVETIQCRQGMFIACIEEIAYKRQYIGAEQLERLARRYASTDYGRYLYDLLKAQ